MDAPVNEKVAVKSVTLKPKETPQIHLVSAQVRDFLNMRRLQGRLTVRQVAALLQCGEHDIPVLVSHGLLTPLGHPPANAQKYFSPVEVLEMAGDSEKMGQVCDVLCRHWQIKNAAKTGATQTRRAPSNGGNGNSSRRLRRN
jgi:hypothetical protein